MENNENLAVKSKVTPKDFFINFFWLITLYGTVISLLNLLFETINRVFPDAVNLYSGGYSASIRTSIACIVVFFPIYIFVTKYLRKTYVIDPLKREVWVRKWFVYLTLFLSAITVMVDVIVLINSFLGGELTTRFVLKVVATLVVVGAVFGYYFFDLKREGISNSVGKIFTISSVVLILASLVWAFVVIGSPMQERLRRFDEQRVQNLQDIQWRITSYWQKNGKLPSGLNEIEDSIGGYKLQVDPETNVAYEYKLVAAKNFQLCANFDLNSTEQATYPKIYGNDYWIHGKGRSCFDRTIDESLYPVNPKIPVSVPAI